MKKIYLVLTHTGTFVAKLIRKHTGHTYNHISISIKEDLSEMYSFGRRNPYVFFYGGFVVESPKRGTFKRFKQTISEVLELCVSDESFTVISDYIQRFTSEKKRFKYNILGIFKARKNIDYQKTYRKFYCSQFVKYLLVCAHIVPEDYFEEVVTPEDFKKIEGLRVIYRGLLRDYDSERIESVALSD